MGEHASCIWLCGSLWLREMPDICRSGVSELALQLAIWLLVGCPEFLTTFVA